MTERDLRCKKGKHLHIGALSISFLEGQLCYRLLRHLLFQEQRVHHAKLQLRPAADKISCHSWA